VILLPGILLAWDVSQDAQPWLAGQPVLWCVMATHSELN